jgi:predicted RNase H-like HicB family nuclease
VSEGEVVAVSKGRYAVIYVRDEAGAWNVHVPEVPGAHTYGRSLHQARQRVREALDLWVDDAADARFEEEIRLPREAQAWFWTTEWQSGEREATGQARRGEGETFETGTDFLDSLD